MALQLFAKMEYVAMGRSITSYGGVFYVCAKTVNGALHLFGAMDVAGVESDIISHGVEHYAANIKCGKDRQCLSTTTMEYNAVTT